MPSTIKVFVENEAGSSQKNIFDEKSLQFKKSVTVSRPYPYPYGFILNTTGGDGDNVDCFIITDQKLKTGETVECKAIGMMLQKEDDKEDNNILAVLESKKDVVLTDSIRSRLTNFITHVFDHRKDKIVEVGEFLDKNSAKEYIRKHLNS